uniref:ubiquitinyl hydrolase 1 n=1 Tax=Anopheles albimanus TaxID=7167 RepID=A0A182FCW8_ANOAL
MYHEKQQRELCALHALNNLFQDKNSFSKSQLDEICQTLSPNEYINPHRDPSCIDTSQIVGFILNVPTTYKVGFVKLPIQRKHWIAVRQINDEFWNLDSKLDAPQCLGNEANLLQYLREQLTSNDKQLFIVCTTEVGNTQRWLLPEADKDQR